MRLVVSNTEKLIPSKHAVYDLGIIVGVDFVFWYITNDNPSNADAAIIRSIHMFPNFVEIASSMPAFMANACTIIIAKPDAKMMIDPITDIFAIALSILTLVPSMESLNRGIRDIGPHNHNEDDAMPATMTWPKREGNLASASGIETT